MKTLPTILLLEEAAEYLRKSEAAIIKMIHEGSLRAIKIGDEYAIDTRSVERAKTEMVKWAS